MYHCNSCKLNFTDGAEAENINILTGKPVESLVEGEDFGEGVCPNCGKPANQHPEEKHEWADNVKGGGK
jgi:hypothetical protein